MQERGTNQHMGLSGPVHLEHALECDILPRLFEESLSRLRLHSLGLFDLSTQEQGDEGVASPSEGIDPRTGLLDRRGPRGGWGGGQRKRGERGGGASGSYWESIEVELLGRNAVQFIIVTTSSPLF